MRLVLSDPRKCSLTCGTPTCPPIACDNPAVEVWPPRWDGGPFGFLHRLLIGQLGLALGELWWLHDLARSSRADGRYTCFLTSAPLNLPGGVGSPANALAVK